MLEIDIQQQNEKLQQNETVPKYNKTYAPQHDQIPPLIFSCYIFN